MVFDLFKIVRLCAPIVVILLLCGLLSFFIYSRLKGQEQSMQPYATVTSVNDLLNSFLRIQTTLKSVHKKVSTTYKRYWISLLQSLMINVRMQIRGVFLM